MDCPCRTRGGEKQTPGVPRQARPFPGRLDMKKKLKKVRSLFFWEVDLGAATAAAGASSAAFGMLTAATAASLWLLRRLGCLGLAVVRETDLGVSALLGLLGFLGVFGLFPPLGGQSLEGEALAVMRLGVAEDRVDAIDQIAD